MITKRAPASVVFAHVQLVEFFRGVCEVCLDDEPCGRWSRYFGIVACADCERGLFRSAIILRDQGEAALLLALYPEGAQP